MVFLHKSNTDKNYTPLFYRLGRTFDEQELSGLLKKNLPIGIINKKEESQQKIITVLKKIKQLKNKMNYSYLKTELATIIDGIENEAKRTNKIVSGLKKIYNLNLILALLC